MATLKFIRLWTGSQWRLERSWDAGTERGERWLVRFCTYDPVSDQTM